MRQINLNSDNQKLGLRRSKQRGIASVVPVVTVAMSASADPVVVESSGGGGGGVKRDTTCARTADRGFQLRQTQHGYTSERGEKLKDPRVNVGALTDTIGESLATQWLRDAFKRGGQAPGGKPPPKTKSRTGARSAVGR
ncbi:hypothetical protein FB451DRAFT_1173110 [Mycena latifolia]|nr:hypothetical protein FB451DRAFT_1173110 [Mycena latifolia]